MTTITYNYQQTLESWITYETKLKTFDDLEGYIISPDLSGWECIKKSIVVNIKRIVHFVQTGIWLDQGAVGQALNSYRWYNGIQNPLDETIKSVLNNKFGSSFVEQAYEEAMKERVSDTIKNGLTFLWGFIKNPLSVGSVTPSSSSLVNTVAKHLPSKDDNAPARYILEAGSGTGTVTWGLVKTLRPIDQLDVIEYDDKFCDILQKRFGHLSNVHIHRQSILDWSSEPKKYDHIISSLPLNVFKADQVMQIYKKFQDVAKDGCQLIYFEYPVLPHIRKLFLSKTNREDFEEVHKIKNTFLDLHKGKREIVWLNCPPARVCRCRITDSTQSNKP